jgi:hypothetical protein
MTRARARTASRPTQRRPRTRSLAILAALALLLAGTTVRAEGAPAADARYAEILATFEANQGREALWWNGWTLFYGVVAGAQGTVALATRDPGLRVDASVGATKATLALGGMLLLTPRTPIRAAAVLRSMDASSDFARTRRLELAEKLLARAANDALFGTSWVAHVAVAIVNLGGAWVQWAGYHRTAQGWIGLAVGLATGEAAILTRPMRTARLWRATSRLQGWTLAPTAGGATLMTTF